MFRNREMNSLKSAKFIQASFIHSVICLEAFSLLYLAFFWPFTRVLTLQIVRMLRALLCAFHPKSAGDSARSCHWSLHSAIARTAIISYLRASARSVAPLLRLVNTCPRRGAANQQQAWRGQEVTSRARAKCTVVTAKYYPTTSSRVGAGRARGFLPLGRHVPAANAQTAVI